MGKGVLRKGGEIYITGYPERGKKHNLISLLKRLLENLQLRSIVWIMVYFTGKRCKGI
jgi:DNA replication protein DnaC